MGLFCIFLVLLLYVFLQELIGFECLVTVQGLHAAMLPQVDSFHVLSFLLEVLGFSSGLSLAQARHAWAGTGELLHPAVALVPQQLHVPCWGLGEVRATVGAGVGALGPPPPPLHHLLPVLPEGGQAGGGVQAVKEVTGGEGGPGGRLRHGGGQGAPEHRLLVLLHHVLVLVAHLGVVVLEGGGGVGTGAGELLHQAIPHVHAVRPLLILLPLPIIGDAQLRVSF